MTKPHAKYLKGMLWVVAAVGALFIVGAGTSNLILGFAVLAGPAILGIGFAVCEWLDIRHLRRHGIEWSRWRWAYYVVTALVPITAVVYAYQRRKRVRREF